MIRPTPENILNYQRGAGLSRMGRRRPPGLWGRKLPLNSPQERGIGLKRWRKYYQ